MNVERYRRRIHRYEFGKRVLLLIGGAIALTIGMGVVSFGDELVLGFAVIVFALLVVAALVVLVYTTYLYVVIRRSNVRTEDVIRADLTSARRALENDRIEPALAALEDLRWTLKNRRSQAIPRPVGVELVDRLESIEYSEGEHEGIASAFDAIHETAIAYIREPVGGGAVPGDSEPMAPGERPEAPTGAPAERPAPDDPAGVATGPERRDEPTIETGDETVVDEHTMDDPTRRRVYRFLMAKRLSIRLLIAPVVLFILYVFVRWNPLIALILLSSVLAPVLLTYTAYLYVVLWRSGVDWGSYDGPKPSLLSVGGLQGSRGGVDRLIGDYRGRGHRVRGAIGNAIDTGLGAVNRSFDAILSAVRKLYGSLGSLVSGRRSAGTVPAEASESRPVDEEDEDVGTDVEPADREVGGPARGSTGEEPLSAGTAGASSPGVRARSTGTGAAHGRDLAGRSSGPTVRLTERVPISGFWLVVGGAFVVGLGLPRMMSGVDPNFGLTFIGTVLAAYSLKLEVEK